MHALRPAIPALLLLLLGSGAAWPQSAAPAPGAPGSLPPPRPVQASPPAASPPAAAPPAAAAPRPAQTAQPRPPQTGAQGQQARPPGQQARPQGQQARPGQPPTVGRAQQPANRRPAAAAAAGVAAGAAAAGAAAAANRTPEPAQPAAPPPPPMPAIGSVTGLALPRFAALRSDEVNMRVGPNTTFPIEWTFQRRDLPVQIIGEFQLWRRIRDVDGAEGWVHSSTLMGRRTVLVRPAATQEVTLRRRAEENAAAVARLRPGVIARIRECEAASPWCEVQVAGHRGFVRRAEVWGIGAEEEIK